MIQELNLNNIINNIDCHNLGVDTDLTEVDYTGLPQFILDEFAEEFEDTDSLDFDPFLEAEVTDNTSRDNVGFIVAANNFLSHLCEHKDFKPEIGIIKDLLACGQTQEVQCKEKFNTATASMRFHNILLEETQKALNPDKKIQELLDDQWSYYRHLFYSDFKQIGLLSEKLNQVKLQEDSVYLLMRYDRREPDQSNPDYSLRKSGAYAYDLEDVFLFYVTQNIRRSIHGLSLSMNGLIASKGCGDTSYIQKSLRHDSIDKLDFIQQDHFYFLYKLDNLAKESLLSHIRQKKVSLEDRVIYLFQEILDGMSIQIDRQLAADLRSAYSQYYLVHDLTKSLESIRTDIGNKNINTRKKRQENKINYEKRLEQLRQDIQEKMEESKCEDGGSFINSYYEHYILEGMDRLEKTIKAWV